MSFGWVCLSVSWLLVISSNAGASQDVHANDRSGGLIVYENWHCSGRKVVVEGQDCHEALRGFVMRSFSIFDKCTDLKEPADAERLCDGGAMIADQR